MRKFGWFILITLALFVPALAQNSGNDFTFGMVLVGFKDDSGWSQAHYEGGLYVEEALDATMIVFENYNEGAADVVSGEVSMRGIVDEMVASGASLIFLTSAEFEDETNVVARAYPEVAFIHIAGDAVLTRTAPNNVGNLMGQMIWAKLIDGCAAGLATETGHIGYVGPLINAETRRLVSAAYLGARHCYSTYRGFDPQDLEFSVGWVGFWFHIPGVTENPTTIAFTMLNRQNVDVLISGIDTQEPVSVAEEFREQGNRVFATTYNNASSCRFYDDVCLGSPYYNWGPAYLDIAQAVMDGTWQPTWDWQRPNFGDPESSLVRFEVGNALTADQRDALEEFIAQLEQYATNQLVPTSFPLWSGPLYLSNGQLLAEDDALVNVLDVWYLPELLTGINENNNPER